MGNIYIIRNSDNSKVYIGQTIHSVEYRFKEHVWMSAKDSSQNKLYTAMKDIGVEKFYAEQIMECEDSNLSYWESYYINEYDSVNNGYNTVYQDVNMVVSRNYDNQDGICADFIEGYSFSEISKRNNVSTSGINRVIEKYGLTRDDTYKRKYSSKKKAVVMYDTDFNELEIFESIKDAVGWIRNNTDFKSSDFGVYAYVNAACTNGNIAYNHRWQLESELTYEDIRFRTTFDIEAYKNGEPFEIVNGHAICNGAFKNVKTYTEKNRCIVCGKEISNKNKMCLDCWRNGTPDQDISRFKAKYPEDDILRKMVANLSFEEIGRQLGVTGKAVKKYCETRGIDKNTHKRGKTFKKINW